MKNAGRWVKYGVFNAIVLAAVYYGLFRGVEGAANLAQFIVWFVFLVSLALMSNDLVDEVVKKTGGPIAPAWLDVPLDLVVLAALAWHGWMWSAAAWVLHSILTNRLRERKAEKLRAAE